jgi:hypothetical protein
MSFNVVQLSLLQVMMVFCLWSFGKQVLPLFFAQYMQGCKLLSDIGQCPTKFGKCPSK